MCRPLRFRPDHVHFMMHIAFSISCTYIYMHIVVHIFTHAKHLEAVHAVPWTAAGCCWDQRSKSSFPQPAVDTWRWTREDFLRANLQQKTNLSTSQLHLSTFIQQWTHWCTLIGILFQNPCRVVGWQCERFQVHVSSCFFGFADHRT